MIDLKITATDFAAAAELERIVKDTDGLTIANMQLREKVQEPTPTPARGAPPTDADWERHKTCRICHQNKPLAEFNRSKNSADGRRNDCRACSLEYSRKYAKAKNKKPSFAAPGFQLDPGAH